MSIQVRLFLGFLQNKEIKVHLNQSKRWKESLLLSSTELIETHWQENSYLGTFVPSSLTFAQIQEKELFVKTQLQVYCPKLNLDKHRSLLFPQIFIT